MLVLALDTALDQTAVAVGDGRRIDAAAVDRMDRGHAERLFPMVEAVLREAGVSLDALDRIAVAVGPGSFTGIRIALSAARGLGLALGKPVVGVGTLRALAASVPERPTGPVLAAVDARRGELYAALYGPDGTPLLAPFAASAEAVLHAVADRAAVAIGSGAPIIGHQAVQAGARRPELIPLAGPDPRAIARLGATLDPATNRPEPAYLRPPDAKPPAAIAGLLLAAAPAGPASGGRS
ncbi:tRNA (adenosine(37)-N6)-threonylcarbamoyltransferase complex dimerization subunit type 1 TsaB [Chthonobacter rhizosphaerae]|uniref:tRNA (adenosine(37)-N6)-threonylcarbamoyltransferase complex dimerization subunit type 1 TsaB n=1 Tax=Chthonobacter rhizosphaerae TaxID=2735553 RepID=UPI0015EF0887|nr:tRNA (adenosine(37)-N6)-threonylcarbamoyltransferase complex dimerization subunit type 1 TsaB [Chthonobacter rhizosphaerae]